MDDRDPRGDPGLGWLESRLNLELGAFSRRPAPRWGVRVTSRRGLGLGRLLATGAAVLALSGGAAMAADLSSAWTSGSHTLPGATPSAGPCAAQASVCAPGHGGGAGHNQSALSGETGGTGSAPPATDGANAHGAAVSGAAHSCPRGSGGVHGQCVSAVAHGSPLPSAVASPKGNGNGGSSSGAATHSPGS